MYDPEPALDKQPLFLECPGQNTTVYPEGKLGPRQTELRDNTLQAICYTGHCCESRQDPKVCALMCLWSRCGWSRQALFGFLARKLPWYWRKERFQLQTPVYGYNDNGLVQWDVENCQNFQARLTLLLEPSPEKAYLAWESAHRGVPSHDQYAWLFLALLRKIWELAFLSVKSQDGAERWLGALADRDGRLALCQEILKLWRPFPNETIAAVVSGVHEAVWDRYMGPAAPMHVDLCWNDSAVRIDWPLIMTNLARLPELESLWIEHVAPAGVDGDTLLCDLLTLRGLTRLSVACTASPANERAPLARRPGLGTVLSHTRLRSLSLGLSFSLRELWLSGCDSLEVIEISCQGLESVALQECRSLARVHLLCQPLRSLQIHSCPALALLPGLAFREGARFVAYGDTTSLLALPVEEPRGVLATAVFSAWTRFPLALIQSIAPYAREMVISNSSAGPPELNLVPLRLGAVLRLENLSALAKLSWEQPKNSGGSNSSEQTAPVGYLRVRGCDSLVTISVKHAWLDLWLDTSIPPTNLTLQDLRRAYLRLPTCAPCSISASNLQMLCLQSPADRRRAPPLTLVPPGVLKLSLDKVHLCHLYQCSPLPRLKILGPASAAAAEAGPGGCATAVAPELVIEGCEQQHPTPLPRVQTQQYGETRNVSFL